MRQLYVEWGVSENQKESGLSDAVRTGKKRRGCVGGCAGKTHAKQRTETVFVSGRQAGALVFFKRI